MVNLEILSGEDRSEFGVGSKLPSDFWENLFDLNDVSSSKDKPGVIMDQDSVNQVLNVSVSRTDFSGITRYHVTVKDNTVVAEALSRGRGALDHPGFIVGSRSYVDFNQAMGVYFAAYKKVNEMGY